MPSQALRDGAHCFGGPFGFLRQSISTASGASSSVDSAFDSLTISTRGIRIINKGQGLNKFSSKAAFAYRP
jgi:hypothetical protein